MCGTIVQKGPPAAVRFEGMGTKMNPQMKAPQKAGLQDYLRSLSYPLQKLPAGIALLRLA
jgi:hypothetical protein